MPSDLQATLERLANLPSTDHPFLSVYLDWQVDGNGNRQSLVNLDDEFGVVADGLKARENVDFDSFNADRARIMDYVNNGAPPEAQGLAIFACDAEGIWEPIPLDVPVPTEITV